MDADVIAAKVSAFQHALVGNPPLEVVRRFVTHGDCCMLSRQEYLDLQHEVSRHFQVSPSEVVVVGSAKLGFSIAPKKRYQPFGDASDVDLALVSPGLFDRAWSDSFARWRAGERWGKEREFAWYLFQGWIRPDKLPPGGEFGADWWEYFRELTASGRYGAFRIRGALFRSWSHLEEYQLVCVRGCMDHLEADWTLRLPTDD